MIAGLEHRPLLVVLASCQSAGDAADTLTSLGPRLVRVGVAAVLAMQGKISMETAALAMPAFFRELSRDGQIDRAAAVARAASHGRPDWWLPVLFLRLYDGRIWAEAESPIAPFTLSDDALARRNRARMLARVRNFWVRGVLEETSGRVGGISLGLAQRRDAVDNPWSGIVNRPEIFGRSRLPASQIVQIFDSAQGGLLILGEPGSGKTTLLLTLARALIERAEHDETLAMPVVFNLASWHERIRTLDDWLVEELCGRYDVLPAIARGWVRQCELMPLLDGFDEVRADLRAGCLDAINAFGRSQAIGELVVCSRLGEYRELRARLHLQVAVEVLPLSTVEVRTYLEHGGAALANVHALFMRDQRFSELIETPLMLNVVSAAYCGDVHMPVSISEVIWREYTFGAYVRRMLDRRGGDLRYPREQVVVWLAHLARALQSHRQSTFLIERIQPTWLQTPGQLLDYQLLIRLLSGICLGTVSIALILPVGGWRLGLASGLAGLLVWSVGWGRLQPWMLGLCYSVAVGAVECYDLPSMTPALQVSYLILAAAVTGLGAWLSARQATFNRIDCIASLRWSWGVGLRAGLLAGFVGGLPIVLALLLLTHDLVIVLAAGAAVGAIGSTLAGMAMGMKAREVETSTRPNEGIWRTLRLALWASAIIGPVFGIMGLFIGEVFRNTAERLDLALMPGLTNIWLTGISGLLSGALLAFLAFGGLTTLQHIVLRLVLYRIGAAPWEYADFLDYCAERVLLRKVGGGYIFIHRMLLEYFADGPEL
jgi:energy-coupling factor transporter ATP-binding protein EcfA2